MNDCSQNLGPRLRYLNNRITQYMDQQFLALDLTSTQSFLLHHLSLHEQEAVYPKDLEKRFHLTHPTVSGVLQRLEAKNFIIIEPDKADRRCKRIRADRPGPAAATRPSARRLRRSSSACAPG